MPSSSQRPVIASMRSHWLKGRQIGGARVSEHHANFLVNVGGATAADILALMRLIQEKVRRDSGIELEPEVHFL